MHVSTSLVIQLLCLVEFVCLPDDYKFDQTKRRYSEDTVVSARGRTLIDTCIQHDLKILNGRILGDRDGKKPVTNRMEVVLSTTL